jgi:YD repeat-containing protein
MDGRCGVCSGFDIRQSFSRDAGIQCFLKQNSKDVEFDLTKCFIQITQLIILFHQDTLTKAFSFDQSVRVFRQNLASRTKDAFAFGQTSTVYDKAGQTISAVDAKGKPTNYVFNAAGNRTAEVDRLGFSTFYEYDAAGNLLSLTDAESQVTSYTYNDAGQRLTEQYPDHTPGSVIGNAGYGIITFTYDELGRRVQKEDQQGDTTSYNVDLAGRMLTRIYTAHATSPLAGQTNTDTFTYDRNGRMLSGIKGRYNNTVTIAYDNGGRKVSESLAIGGQTYTTTSIYDDIGQLTGYVYPDGTAVGRSYTKTRTGTGIICRGRERKGIRNIQGVGATLTRSMPRFGAK